MPELMHSCVLCGFKESTSCLTKTVAPGHSKSGMEMTPAAPYLQVARSWLSSTENSFTALVRYPLYCSFFVSFGLAFLFHLSAFPSLLLFSTS